MIEVGTPLSDVLGDNVTFASSQGPSDLGNVLAATGFSATEQQSSAPAAADSGIEGLVRTNIAPAAKGLSK